MIQAPAGRFVLDPIARYVGGASGKIDFCVFPSYDYVMIVRTDAGWQFETNPKTISRPWSKQTFFEVVVRTGQEGMTPRQRRLERMRAIEREWLVASIAAGRFGERLRANPSALAEKQLETADYRNFRDNLEPTYLIRVFAEFEAGLREAWALAFHQTTSPRMRDLIDAFSARCAHLPTSGATLSTMSAPIATPCSTKGAATSSPSACARHAAICAASSAACPIDGNRPCRCGRHPAAPAEESRPCPWKTTC